jgi:hypothetical protein
MKHILSAFEAGKLKSTVTFEAALRRYREYARATLSKSKRMNIRLSTPDLSESRRVPQKKVSPIKHLLPVYCINSWQAALSKNHRV